jgi:choline-sulfatase
VQNNSTPFLPVHRTMAHHFNRAGYMTGLIGKMHFVDAQTHGFEYRLDFNDWMQYLGPKTQIFADELGKLASGSGLPQIDDLWREEGDPWASHRTKDDRQGPVAVGRVSLLAEQDHFESFVARESVRFLKNFGATGQPFFLVSSFLKPHDPFMPAQRFVDMFRPEDMRLPNSWGKADKSKLPQTVVKAIDLNVFTPELRDPATARRHIAFYYANLAQMDDCLGRIVRALKDLNLENDTIICYTSDHGEMLGELGLWQKFQFYEGSCGVPLMIRVPGRQAGICETPVSLVSLSATLTELAGVEQIAPNDGVSLVPSITFPLREKNYGPVFAEYGLTSRQPKAMIRTGRWKYTYWLHDTPELYDLKSDPEELRNLAEEPEHAAIAGELRAQLLSWNRPM